MDNKQAKSEVNPYGQVLVGDGVTVEMAVFLEKNKSGLNDVLLKITGGPAVDAGIDGKTLKYEAINAGTGIDYIYKDGNQPNTRMSGRSSMADYPLYYDVYLNKKTYRLNKDGEKSKESLPAYLLTDYKKSKGK